MDGLDSLSLEMEYRTGENNLVEGFYSPCLSVAKNYDRSVGYFRSSIFSLVGYGIVEFVRRGGKMRLICSPDLTDEDVKAMKKGYQSKNEVIEKVLMKEINDLLTDIVTRERTVILATLIAVGALEIKIAFNAAGRGIYHEKLGIFIDAQKNVVSFKGSPNESWAAWHEYGNFESFDVFCSWLSGNDEIRARKHALYFEALWDGSVPQIETLPFPDVVTRRLKDVAHVTLEDIYMPKEKQKLQKEPLEHQLKAIEGWRNSGFKGIFQHATGSGKTYTAILAIKEHCECGLPALVIVPSSLLFGQWKSELNLELPTIPIVGVGDGNQIWKRENRLESFSDSDTELGPRIILATAQTASKREFLSRIIDGEHLMIVADEVHRMGSQQNANLLTLRAGKRLGLSATPRRYGDKEGTDRIFSYFGDIIPPIITLKDAIDKGRLVPYEYFPHKVTLDAEEMEEWGRIGKQISRLIASKHVQGEDISNIPSDIKHLLIRRARIAKKAKDKVNLAREVIHDYFEEGQSWLIYCEDVEQLNEVSEKIKEDGYKPMHYYTSMEGSHSDTLDWFSRYGGLLLSIRCLDEGVDIPSISHALILASSRNPREFIQRRGRVLRKDRRNPNKTVAVIHDALVVPNDVESEVNTLSLVKSEIGRALEFANSALNPGSQIELILLATELGIDIENLVNTGVEVDDDE